MKKLLTLAKRIPEIAKSIVAGVGGILTALTGLEATAHLNLIPTDWQPYITFGLAVLTGIAAWKVPNAPKATPK